MREDFYVPSGCAVAGILNQDGERISGETIIRSVATMHERSNGLGGGFAVYGIYPEFSELYAFHLLYDEEDRESEVEEMLRKKFSIEKVEFIPVRASREINDYPLF